jgi:hypothetical protein
MTPAEIHAYLARPSRDRPGAFFREDHFAPRPYYDSTAYQSLQDCHVSYETGLNHQSTLNETRALADVASGSAAMEGSTYTLGDTLHLLDTGTAKEGAAADDTQLVVTHFRAWRYLVQRPHPSLQDLLVVHRLLMSADGVVGSPHFLDDDRAGKWRIDSPDGLVIEGSAYIPPQTQDRGPTFLPDHVEQLRTKIRLLPNPMDRSLAWLSRLPYLQPFADGNKRMGRILAAAEFRWASLRVPQMVRMDRKTYLHALLAFYELGELQPLAEVFQLAVDMARALVTIPLPDS